MPQHSPPPGADGPGASANDRFKRRAHEWFWSAIVLSVGLHAVAFAMPLYEAETPAKYASVEPVTIIDITEIVSVSTIISSLPEILRPYLPQLPDLPTGIAMPEVPAMTFDAPEIPAPAPATEPDGLDGYTEFGPAMVKPTLTNRRAVQRALERRYPSSYRNAGVQGSVTIVLWIDESGTVRNQMIEGFDGSEAFDEAARAVVPMMEFEPSLRNGLPVRTIVRLPINFMLR